MNKSNVPYSKIAEKLGVSPSTISRALRQPHLVKHATLKQIYNAIEELGGSLPECAPSLSCETRLLVLGPTLSNPFFIDIVQGIQDAANLHGCQLLIANEMLTQFNIQRILRFITQSDISGVVILQKVEENILEQLRIRTEVIQCSEFNEIDGISYITIDNIDATKKLIRYILATGRKKIALINCDITRYTYAKLRLQGYTEALEEAGITPDPELIITIPDNKFNVAVPAISTMLKTQDIPDAIVCISDTMAAAALRACALEGYRVPQDIVVTGFDNIDISVMTTPNITTINQPKHDMGFMACTQLLSMIANPKKEPQKFILDTELILRESTDF